MGIDRDTFDQLRHLLRPLATRIANTVARAVIQLADDGKKLQLLQLGVLAGETVDDGEHHQPYGFSSVPLGGAEAVVVFPNGDRSHPLVVSVSDRRHRPTGGKGGEVCMYTDEGDVIRLGRGHLITVDAGATGTVTLSALAVKLGSPTAAEPAIKGTSRVAADQALMIALSAYIAAVQPFADPTVTATPLLTSAIGAYVSAITAALSTKVTLE